MMNPYLNPPSTLNLPGAYMAAQQANMGQMQQNEYMRQLNAAQSSRNAYTDYLNQNPDASDEDKLNFAQNQTLKQGDVGGFEKMQNLKSMAAERDANAGYKKKPANATGGSLMEGIYSDTLARLVTLLVCSPRYWRSRAERAHAPADRVQFSGREPAGDATARFCRRPRALEPAAEQGLVRLQRQ